jgi:hypothetical protein
MLPFNHRRRLMESSMELRDHWEGREAMSVGEAFGLVMGPRL